MWLALVGLALLLALGIALGRALGRGSEDISRANRSGPDPDIFLSAGSNLAPPPPD